jgi:hypothetical protein
MNFSTISISHSEIPSYDVRHEQVINRLYLITINHPNNIEKGIKVQLKRMSSDF